MKRPSRSIVFAAAALALAIAAVDCTKKAAAEPLRVTYYYLPG
jgi:hypothetical protein